MKVLNDSNLLVGCTIECGYGEIKEEYQRGKDSECTET